MFSRITVSKTQGSTVVSERFRARAASVPPPAAVLDIRSIFTKSIAQSPSDIASSGHGTRCAFGPTALRGPTLHRC
jgi:hypothetical protein